MRKTCAEADQLKVKVGDEARSCSQLCSAGSLYSTASCRVEYTRALPRLQAEEWLGCAALGCCAGRRRAEAAAAQQWTRREANANAAGSQAGREEGWQPAMTRQGGRRHG